MRGERAWIDDGFVSGKCLRAHRLGNRAEVGRMDRKEKVLGNRKKEGIGVFSTQTPLTR